MNEIYTDWSKRENRSRMERAIAKIESEFEREYPLIIGNKQVTLDAKLKSYNPSNPNQVVGIFQKGGKEEALNALDVALDAFEKWRWIDSCKRADFLFKAAKVMRRRRFEMNATMVLEVGKTWPEAEADTSEAIDFLEFYAREILRYGAEQPVVQLKGECDELRYIPLGVGLVVPPWNFPLAILTGMTMAAVVTGNTVILKPSSDSPLTGWRLMEILDEIKLPKGVVNFVTGSGATVGDTLVAHPQIRFISFTGSKEVGIHINELAAKVQSGQRWLKRVVAEMGGKDSLIIDDQANLDEAAAATVVSAFGFQGEKCSACSRAIVVEKVYDGFISLLKKRVETIKVGDAKDFSNYMGPVINISAKENILKYIRIGLEEGGRLISGGEEAPGDGYFIKPTVIADVDPKATIAQEEIFGPVLAVIKAKNFDEALAIANNTEFGLTAGIFTRNRRKIEKAKDIVHVGNFYINRKITGAMVGAHPFGGFNMSGTDSKAGGRDYLLLYLQGKSIAEKVK
jgi:1-pyrroline-5-carboxylate dehydrogenase